MAMQHLSDVTETLTRSALFADLPGANYTDLARLWTVLTISDDGYLLTQDEVSTDIYMVMSGALDVCIDDGMDRRTAFRVAGVGDVVGELSAIDGLPRSADVISRGVCKLARLPAAEFRHLLALHPLLCQRVMHNLAREVRQLSRRVAAIAHQSCGQRLREVLLRDAQPGEAGELQIPRRLNQAQLAERVGVRRESINRHLQAWRRAGLIDIQPDAYRVLNPEGLREAVLHME